MDEQISIDGDWMSDITPKTATLKIKDGETVDFKFLNNGIKKESIDYGNSVAFQVEVKGAEMTFYVKSNNFDLLGQIKEIAKLNNNSLVGLDARISRKGSKRSDTRYTIVRKFGFM